MIVKLIENAPIKGKDAPISGENAPVNGESAPVNAPVNAEDGTLNGTLNGSLNGSLNGTLNGSLNENLEKERELLNLISKYPNYGYEQYAELTQLSRRTIARMMKQLQDINAVCRIGSKKIGYWKVIEKP